MAVTVFSVIGEVIFFEGICRYSYFVQVQSQPRMKTQGPKHNAFFLLPRQKFNRIFQESKSGTLPTIKKVKVTQKCDLREVNKMVTPPVYEIISQQIFFSRMTNIFM